MVRKAAAVLLGCRTQLQSIWRQRNISTIAERDRSAVGNTNARLAGLARLRQRNRAMAPALATFERRHDRILALRGNRHALQRDADVRDGSGGCAAGDGAFRERGRSLCGSRFWD